MTRATSERLELWRANIGLAKSIAARRARILPIRGAGALDDLTQSALLALWDATKHWSLSRASFTTFAYRAVLGAVRCESWRVMFWGFNGNRAARLKGFVLAGRKAVLWAGNGDGTPDEGHPFELPPDRLAAKELAETLLDCVPSETEREVARLYYIDGLSTRHVAEKLGVSVDRVEQARPRAIARMRRVAADMGLFDEEG